MPAVVTTALALLLLTGTPALAGSDAQPADTGFPLVLLVLAVVATLGALGWRAISRRRQDDRS